LLLQLLAGVKTPDEGYVFIREEGRNASAPKVKAKIGYVPSNPVFYGDMTVTEIMDFVGQARGIGADKRYRQIKEAMDLTGIEDIGSRLAGKLNVEQRKRLSYACALLGNPDVLLVDEPIPVKDAAKRAEFMDLLVMLGRVKTVIMASADFSVVRKLCEDVLIMAEGTLLVQGSFESLEGKLLQSRGMRVSTRGEGSALCEAIRSIRGVLDCQIRLESSSETALYVEFRSGQDIREEVSRLLGSMGAPILSMSVENLSLESVYRSLTASARHKADGEVTK
jgi:ABC-2 type transport system ATP-binding protein